MNSGKYLLLYASNEIVLGECGAAIYCFDRNLLVLVPVSMYWVIKELEETPLDQLRIELNEEVDIFDSYIDFLVNHEFAFTTDFPERFPKKSLEFDVHEILISATVRYSGKYDFKKVVNDLNECDCRHLRIYLSKELSTNFYVFNILELTRSSTLRTVDMVIHAGDRWDEDLIERLSKAFPKLLSITICDSPAYSCAGSFGVLVIRLTIGYLEFIQSRPIKNYAILDQRFFVECQRYNPYFNLKAFIDEDGEIKNGKDEEISFGNIQTASLAETVTQPEFQRRWTDISPQLLNSEFRYCIYNPDTDLDPSAFQNCENKWTLSF
jgi:hypothetical protein